MAQIIIHLWHYLVRVMDYAITLGGTSRVGFFVILLVPPIFAALRAARKSVKQGASWRQALSDLKPLSLFRSPVVVIWLGLVVWSFGAITYQDHEGLVAAKRGIIADKNALAMNDQTIIGDLRHELDAAQKPSGPTWAWEFEPGRNQDATALVTVHSPIEGMVFSVKCSVPCVEQGSQAFTGTGTWLDAKATADPTVVRIRVLMPDRLNSGQQIAFSFDDPEPIVAPNPPKKLSILWVHLEKGSVPNQ